MCHYTQVQTFYSRLTLSILLLLTSFSGILAQPVVNSLSPAKNSNSSSPASNVGMSFSENMHAASASNTVFMVYGSMSGFKSGTYSGGGSATLSFDPSNDFFPGERVSVVANTNMQNTANNGMLYPYVYSYMVKPAAGLGVFKHYVDITPVFSLGIAHGSTPQHQVAGDFDNDGRVDLLNAYSGLVTSSYYIRVAFVRNMNQNAFAITTVDNYAGAPNFLGDLKVTDCDNDGDLDVYYSIVSNSSIILLRNDGTGTFTRSTAGVTGAGVIQTFEIEDFDGDGFQDVVITGNSNQLRILKNSGNGNLAFYTSVALGNNCSHIASADFNGDGNVDCAASSSISTNMFIRINDGSGILFGGSTVAVTGTPGVTRSADLDNDGDLDLIALIRGQNKLQIFSNNGSASFASSGTLAVSNSTVSVNNFNIADFDADGDLDIVSGHKTNSLGTTSLVVFRNDGAMNFTTFSYPMIHTTIGSSFETADFNGDGTVDIVNGNHAHYNETLLPVIHSYTPAYGKAGTEVTITGLRLRSITGVNFNNTPATSYTVLSEMMIKATVAPNTTSGKIHLGVFTSTVSTAGNFDILGNVSAVSPPPGSHTSQRNTDIHVIFNRGMNQVLNNGAYVIVQGSKSPGRSTPSNFITSGANSRTLTVNPNKDFLPGENVRVMVKNSSTDSLGISLENAYEFEFRVQSSSVSAVSYPTPTIVPYANLPRHVKLADIDNDGDLDEIIGNSTGIQYRKNSGTGTFGPITTITYTSSVSGLGVRCLDVDNDGDLDIFYSGRIQLNSGTGVFTQANTVLTADGDFMDINGDGYLDFFYSLSSSTVSWIVNNGNGTFSGSGTLIGTPAGAATNSNSKPIAYDFDNDGKMDIARAGNDTVYFYRNLGGGQFTLQTKHRTFLTVRKFITGDFNNDGVTDLGIASDAVDVIRFYHSPGSLNGATQSIIHLTNNTSNTAFDLQSIDVADINGDGKLDIFAANGNAKSISYVLNTTAFSGLSWAPTQTVSCGTSTVTDIAAGDLDGDGDIDFGTANANDNTSCIGILGGSPNPPVLTAFSPSTGAVGSIVTVSGTNIACISSVSLNGVAASFGQTGPGTFTLIVPVGATSGQIAVTCTSGVASAPGVFYVCPGGIVSPSVSFSQNPSGAVCAGTAVSFTADLSAAGYAPVVTWLVNSNPAGQNQVFNSTFASSGVAVTLSVTSQDGCLSTPNATAGTIISVNPSPITPGTIAIPVSCGSPLSFSVAPVAGATTYSWSTPSGWSGTSSTNSLTATPTTGGYVSVQSVNGCGTSGPSSTYVEPSSGALTVSASVSSPTICTAGTNVTLTAASTGSISSSEFGWVKHFKSPNEERFRDVENDVNGDVIGLGHFHLATTLDDSITITSSTPGIKGAFLTKLNGQGIPKWTTRLHATGGCNAAGITSDNAGNIYIAGDFSGTMMLGGYSVTSVSNLGGFEDLFYAKLDVNGNCLWLKRGGSSFQDFAYDIEVDASGNPYINGVLSGAPAAHPRTIGTATYSIGANSSSSTGGRDIFVVKADPATGDPVWIYKTSYVTLSSPSNFIADLSVDAAGNSYLWGSLVGPHSFPGIGSTGSSFSGAAVLKVSSTGSLVAGQFYSFTGRTNAIVNDGNYIYFSGSQSGNSTVTYGGSSFSLTTVSGTDKDFLIKKDINTMSTVWLKKLLEGNSFTDGPAKKIEMDYSGGHLYFAIDFDNSENASWGVVSSASLVGSDGDVLIVKADTSGNAIAYARTNTSNNYEANGSISVGPSGVFVALHAYPNASFGDQYYVGEGSFDAYILKVIPQGPGNVNIGYAWQPGGATGTAAPVSPPGTTVYTVTASSGGCASTATVEVTVMTPTIAATASLPSICFGDSTGLNVSGALSYTWSPANGLNALQGASITSGPTVTTVYSVTGTDGNGCTGSSSVAVQVKPLPAIGITPAAATICAGSATNIVASGALTYTWNPTSSVSNSVSASVSANPPSTTIYTVAGTNSVGCSNTKTVSISVTPLPTVSIIPGPTVICSGSTTSQFTMTGASVYTLTPGFVTSSSVVVLGPNVTTTYTLTGTTAGCTGSTGAVQTVSVNPSPTVAISVMPSTAICIGQSATVSVGGALTYTWSTASNSDSFVITPATNTVYTVTGTDVNGCLGATTRSVVVNPLPTLSISGPTAVCFGNSVNNTASGASSYLWSSGQPFNIASLNPTVTSVYTVTGTSSQGCQNTITRTITVMPLPTVTIAGGDIPICQGAQAGLLAGGANTYSWSNSATSASINVFPIINPTSFTVTGTDANGCKSTVNTTFTVMPLPNVTITGPSTLCSGYTATLTGNGAQSYLWNTTSTLSTATISPSTTTQYVAQGTGTNGCTNLAFKTVTVTPSPSISAASGSICLGKSFNINLSGAPTYSYLSGASVVSPTVTTTYTIVGINSTSCVSAPLLVNVTVVPLPTVSVNSGSVCYGKSFTLQPNGASSYTYQGGNSVVGPLSSTSYTVIGKNSEGCVAANAATAIVSVEPLPIITVAGATTCAGSPVVLQPTGGVTYSYSSGSATVSPAVTTNYYVAGTGTNGCISSPSTLVTVTVSPLPTLGIAGSNSVCSGNSITLSMTGNAATYTWSAGNATTSSILVSPGANATYTLNGLSAAGCTNTAQKSVIVHTTPTISVAGGSICAGEIFTISPSGADNYLYQGGSATVSPSSTGNFTVAGTSNQGCASSNTVTITVTVNPIPIITVSSATICNGQTTVITYSGAASYSISGGTATVAPVVTTTYSVSGTSSLGCVASPTALATVSVIQLPAVSIIGSPTLCAGETLTLQANGASGYQWSNNSTQSIISVTPAANTNYSVTGTSAGACQNTAAISVTVHALPVVTISGTNAVCAGGSVSLTASGAATYSWNTNQTLSSIQVTPGATSAYSVTGTNILGCKNFALHNITVHVLPVLNVSVQNGSVCAGSTAVLNATGAQTFSWSGGVVNNVAFVPATTSTYVVTGTDPNGCVDTETASVFVHTLPNVVASSSPTRICSGETAILTASGANSFTWNTTEMTASISILPSVTSNYTVTGTDGNGCLKSFVVTMEVDPCTGALIKVTTQVLSIYPNPNEGLFTIRYDEAGPETHVEVFTALGQLVVQSPMRSGQLEINVAGFDNGVYFVKVYESKRLVRMEKIIKQ